MGKTVILDFVKSQKNIADPLTKSLFMRCGPRYIVGDGVKPKEGLIDSVNLTFLIGELFP